MHRYPPPNIHDLLLPIIACLPTAFFSPQPPPALLPFLSPILRQRFSLNSQTPPSDPSTRPNTWENNWLNLLTWSPQRAQQLRDICSELQLEPHPVSGELELFEDEPECIEYRHLDAETVQAKCDVRKHGISLVWTWCTNDAGTAGMHAISGTSTSNGSQDLEDGWRIAEVRPIAGTESETWYPSQAEAESVPPIPHSSPSTTSYPSAPNPPTISRPTTSTSATSESAASEDDYWASYDRTPAARTPAKRSPGPPLNANSGLHLLTRRDSESEYFDRYSSEVQPALDAHDPDEATEDFDSTLGPKQETRSRSLHGQVTPPSEGEGIAGSKRRPVEDAEGDAYPMPCTEIPPQSTIPPSSAPRVPQPSHTDEALPALNHTPPSQTHTQTQPLHSPKPSRSTSPISRLEHQASATSAAEVGVKQHISTEIKSLYRLARAAGIEREEFERVVRREVSVLGMMDEI